MHRGFIKDWRKSEDSALYWDVQVWHLFMHIVKRAAWKPMNGLNRGEYVVPVQTLAESYGVGRSTIHRWIDKLVEAEMLEKQPCGTGRLIVSVCNYKTYQDESQNVGTSAGQERDASGTAAGRKRDTKEEVKNSSIEALNEKGAASPPAKPLPAEKPVKVKPEEVTIPGELDTAEFRAARDAWFAQRRRKRLSLQAEYVTGQYARLLPLGPAKAAACLLHSAHNNYDGVFPEKFANGTQYGKSVQQRTGAGQRFQGS